MVRQWSLLTCRTYERDWNALERLSGSLINYRETFWLAKTFWLANKERLSGSLINEKLSGSLIVETLVERLSGSLINYLESLLGVLF